MQAYFKTEYKTITDIILKKTSKLINEPIKEWIQKIHTSQGIYEYAIEDNSTILKRKNLKDNIYILKECKKKIQNMNYS